MAVSETEHVKHHKSCPDGTCTRDPNMNLVIQYGLLGLVLGLGLGFISYSRIWRPLALPYMCPQPSLGPYDWEVSQYLRIHMYVTCAAMFHHIQTTHSKTYSSSESAVRRAIVRAPGPLFKQCSCSKKSYSKSSWAIN